MCYADVLLVQVYLPYALGFCFSANYFMLCASLLQLLTGILTLIPYQSDFFQCSVCDFDGCELTKSPVFMVSF